MTSTLISTLRACVGDDHVLVDPDLRAGFERDWTGRFGGAALAVVRPAAAGQVAAVLRACAAAGVAVVPQGGNTGLVGGSVPSGGEVLLSLTRLCDIAEVERATGQLEAGAGATLAAVQARAATAGMALGVDFGARDSATVGGAVATNAGGIHALRYGTMGRQLAGLEAVFADGTVMQRLSGLIKDNAGYDLTSLLAGSEGTLAVITRVRLRLVPAQPAQATALVALERIEDAVELLGILRERAPSLHAVELIDAAALSLALARQARPAPIEVGPVNVLVECAATTDRLDELAEALEAAPFLCAAAVADDGAGCAALWALRESITEAIAAEGVPHKLDVGVPTSALAGFTNELRALVDRLRPDARLVLFGHLGDGNLHVNLLGLTAADDALDRAVLALVAAHGGTISAEHGVGRAKVDYLGLTRSDAEIAAMRRIKDALDPAGLLNPGVLLPRG